MQQLAKKMPQARQRDNPAKVERLRVFRRLRSEAKRRLTDPAVGPSGKILSVDNSRGRNAAWALRMTRRLIEPGKEMFIHRDFRFWLGYAAGWRFDDPIHCFDAAGTPCEAVASRSFDWWCKLHPEERLFIVRKHRAKRYAAEKDTE